MNFQITKKNDIARKNIQLLYLFMCFACLLVWFLFITRYHYVSICAIWSIFIAYFTLECKWLFYYFNNSIRKRKSLKESTIVNIVDFLSIYSTSSKTELSYSNNLWQIHDCSRFYFRNFTKLSYICECNAQISKYS